MPSFLNDSPTRWASVGCQSKPSVPWSQWSPRERTQAQVASAFGLADVVRIDLSARTAGGGVRSAVATSSTGATATISGESLRSRLSLPGTWVQRAVVAAHDPGPRQTGTSYSRNASPRR